MKKNIKSCWSDRTNDARIESAVGGICLLGRWTSMPKEGGARRRLFTFIEKVFV